MEVDVEDGLPGGGLVELNDAHAVGLERLLHAARDVLRRLDQLGQRCRLDVEEVARVRLRDHQRVTVGLRHRVHERERALVLETLNAGISPRMIFAKTLLWSYMSDPRFAECVHDLADRVAERRVLGFELDGQRVEVLDQRMLLAGRGRACRAAA